MIQVADNFNYRGKKPNFDRDSFDTLQDMKNYSENSLDDGHILIVAKMKTCSQLLQH